MAQIELEPEELEGGLPPVCIRCGAPATVWREKYFEFPEPKESFFLAVGGYVFHPLHLLYMARLAKSFFRSKLCLRAPFCDAHRNHWFLWKLIIRGGLIGWLVCFLAGLGIARGVGSEGGEVFVASFVAFVIWCVAAVIAHETSIHQEKITANALILKGVSADFVEALEAQRNE